MADIGTQLVPETLWLVKRRDFTTTEEYVDELGNVQNYPPGDLFLELNTLPAITEFHFTITGSKATLTIPAATVDTLPAGISWQLVFRPTGDTGSGEAVALGCVEVTEGCCD